MSDQMNSASECGCQIKAVEFEPCEEHRKSIESGDERLNLKVEFHDKFSRWNQSRHKVNLERVQRIQLGIDSEEMEFSEVSLADMLQQMADDRPYETEAFVLRALANAFRGEDSDHHLLLKQNKPGKWESPTEFERRSNRDMSWLWTLGNWERDGMKTEAAVARIAELAGVSRASVFAGVKRAEEFLDRVWNIGGKPRFGPRPLHLTNPRPAKNSDS